MRFYVAAKDQNKGRRLRELLVLRGHEVTARWLDASDYGKGPPYDEKARAEAAEVCRQDVLAADAIVMIAGEGQKGGRHVELGMAIALAKRCYVIGKRENVFHWLPSVVVCADENEFQKSVEQIDTEPGVKHDRAVDGVL